MSLYATNKADYVNTAPKHAIAMGITATVNVANALTSVNGSLAFANTQANAFHANLTIGVFGITANVKKAVGAVVNAAGAGYLINDLLSFDNTGAVPGNANANLVVSNIAVVYANVMLGGAGYSNGDIVRIPGTAGSGLHAWLNVTVGNAIVGNVSTVSFVKNGSYSANFSSLSNIQVTNVSGSNTGNAFSVNVGTGIASLAVNNSGAYFTVPTTLNIVTLNGGSGVGGKANLDISLQANKTGGSGWVQKTVRQDGKTTYEILVAGRSIWNDTRPDTDKGTW